MVVSMESNVNITILKCDIINQTSENSGYLPIQDR